MPKKGRRIVAFALLGVLTGGGLAVAAGLRGPRAPGTGKPLGLPTGADPTLPVQTVGVATGYARTQLVDTGAINYDYMGPGWAYAGIAKDW